MKATLRFGVVAVPLLLAGALFFAGCQDTTTKKAEPPPEPTAAAPQTVPRETILPEDVPTYAGLVVQTLTSSTDGKTYLMQGHAGDVMESVEDAFRQNAEEKGWSAAGPAVASADGNMATLLFTKPGKRLNVTLFRTDTGTSINLTGSPG